MPLEAIAWAIDGGIVSGSLARMLAYQATGGEEGVAGIGDFVVRQTAVASGQVRIGNGGGVLINRYPGAKNESYMVRAGDESLVSVPQNASGSTRYDLVIARVDDWNMPGGTPLPAGTVVPTDEVDTAKFQVITGVPSTTMRASELGLNYPAIALARIAIPAATSAVTTAMITDLREKAVPRRERRLLALGQLAGRDNTLTVTNASGERFPDDGLWTIEVPYWATQVRIRGDWGGIYVPAGTTYAKIWLRLWDQTANAVNIQASLIDYTAGRNDPGRTQGMTADTVSVPAAVRGTSQKVAMIGQRLSGTVNIKADAATAMVVDMEFLEAPTEDL